MVVVPAVVPVTVTVAPAAVRLTIPVGVAVQVRPTPVVTSVSTCEPSWHTESIPRMESGTGLMMSSPLLVQAPAADVKNIVADPELSPVTTPLTESIFARDVSDMLHLPVTDSDKELSVEPTHTNEGLANAGGNGFTVTR